MNPFKFLWSRLKGLFSRKTAAAFLADLLSDAYEKHADDLLRVIGNLREVHGRAGLQLWWGDLWKEAREVVDDLDDSVLASLLNLLYKEHKLTNG